MGTTITNLGNITLVTLNGSPAKTDFIAEVFHRIAKYNINVDMISMAPTHADITELSFTIQDDDLVRILPMTKELKKDLGINASVSSANCKIAIFDKEMKNTPGIAARFFSAIKSTDADIRLITTSEVEISLLIRESDFDRVITAVEKAFA